MNTIKNTSFYLILFLSLSRLCATVGVKDFSGFYHAEVDRIEYPKNISELRHSITATSKPIALAGGKYSMGGQVWVPDGIVIDTKYLNAIIAFDPERNTITVQAGALWRDVQEFLLKYGRSVKIMQSYNDFSVGGSLSVNAHGRDPHGQLIASVESVTVMLANGSLVKASRVENADLFSGVIGGYGACGSIVDATLSLEDNYKIKRVVEIVPVADFIHFYNEKIAHNNQIALYNANLYGPEYDKIVSFSWVKTDEPLTINDLMRKHDLKQSSGDTLIAGYVEYAVSEFYVAQKLRFLIDNVIAKNPKYVVWRSYEMSHSVKSLATNSHKVSKILQEYFIPIKHFNAFVNAMKAIFTRYGVKVINISIRHVPKNSESLLSYATEDCFAFVCYIALDNTPESHAQVGIWTREIIDAALAFQGTYYLPYHRFASPEQCIAAYPRCSEFLAVKKKYDPTGKFQNSLISSWAECDA